MSKLFGGVTMLALIVLIVAIGPIFSIMALNTLFNTGIELTFGTWCAALWLGIVIRGVSSTKS